MDPLKSRSPLFRASERSWRRTTLFAALTLLSAGIAHAQGRRIWVPLGPPVDFDPGSVVHALELGAPGSRELVAGSPHGGIWTSADDGTTWNGPAEGTADLQATQIVRDPFDPTIFYAGTFNGIWKSVDSGASWSATGPAGYWDEPPFTIGRGWALSVEVDRSLPSVVYAGTAVGIFRSGDAGATWTNVFGSEAQYDFIHAIAADSGASGVVYAGAESGFFRSTDHGETWAPANVSPDTYPNVVMLAADRVHAGRAFAVVSRSACVPEGCGPIPLPLLRTADGGATWEALPSPPGRDVFALAAPGAPGVVYATTAEGVFRSADDGDTWTALGRIPVGGVARLAIDPTEARIFAGTAGGGGVYGYLPSSVTSSSAPPAPARVRRQP